MFSHFPWRSDGWDVFVGVLRDENRGAGIPGGQYNRLEMEARIIADRSRVMKFACSAQVDGEIACVAEIICVEKALE